jgi:hypothetical protein
MADLSLDELRAWWGEAKLDAEGALRLYAYKHCPSVTKQDLDVICKAIGDISVEEARVALDKLQKERVGTYLTETE